MGAIVNLGLFNTQVMTAAINRMPNMYIDPNIQPMFRFVAETSKTAMFEVRDQKLVLLNTKPWGGVGTVVTGSSRKRVPILIPHTPAEGLVTASDVSGIAAFGSTTTLETVTERVMDVNLTTKNILDQTTAYRQLSAIKGVVMDGDGTTVLQDLYSLFGVTQTTVNFDLSNTATDVKAKCAQVRRLIAKNVMGDRVTGVRCIVSTEFMDLLKDHKSVKELYANWYAAATLSGASTDEFSFGGITFVESVAEVGGLRFVAAGEGHAYPLGTVDTFLEVAAPAETVDWVNTRAQRYYSQTEILPFGAGLQVKSETNVLPICARPAALVKVTAS